MLQRTLVMGALLLAAACSSDSMTENLGLSKVAPDEFTVVSRPALSVPPDFTLRPPRPGEGPRAPTADATAHGLILGTPAKLPQSENDLAQPTVETAVPPVITSSQPTGAESALLKRAGANAAKEDIRDQLNEDAAKPADTSKAKSLLEKVTGAEKDEPVVDAKKEAERLRDNKDNGKPVNAGDVPNETVKPPSVLDRIF